MNRGLQRTEQENRAVDAWLRQEFAARYEAVREETLPVKLLALLDRFD